MTQPKLSSISELRDDLLRAYQEMRAGALDDDHAKELANVAGKIIKSAQVQVAYYALRKDIPNIGFLRDDTAT